MPLKRSPKGPKSIFSNEASNISALSFSKSELKIKEKTSAKINKVNIISSKFFTLFRRDSTSEDILLSSKTLLI